MNGLDFVFLRGRNGYAEYTMRLCKALAIQTGREYFVDARELHRRMISGGVAVGFVPEGFADMYRNDPSIRLMPIHDRRFSRKMMICFKREKRLSPLAREFRDFALEYFKLG